MLGEATGQAAEIRMLPGEGHSKGRGVIPVDRDAAGHHVTTSFRIAAAVDGRSGPAACVVQLARDQPPVQGEQRRRGSAADQSRPG